MASATATDATTTTTTVAKSTPKRPRETDCWAVVIEMFRHMLEHKIPFYAAITRTDGAPVPIPLTIQRVSTDEGKVWFNEPTSKDAPMCQSALPGLNGGAPLCLNCDRFWTDADLVLMPMLHDGPACLYVTRALLLANASRVEDCDVKRGNAPWDWRYDVKDSLYAEVKWTASDLPPAV